MTLQNIRSMKFGLSPIEQILDRRRWIMYLILHDGIAKEIRFNPDEKFYTLVEQQLTAYMKTGAMPPKEIAPAILNLGDDLLAGREPVLRAGDYIAIQNYMRSV